MSFIVNRDRDAWPTIRGFVSQVDLTIKRWLELSGNDILELERGEDIDIVASELLKNKDLRVVEQVKRRETSITLRSPECLEALANFIEHRITNPEVQLLFRFTTNASRGLEHPQLFGDGRRGIDVWDKIHRHEISTGAWISELQIVRDTLKRAMKPASLNIAVWTALEAFLTKATDDDIRTLIETFEWSTEAALGDSLAQQLQSILIAKGHAKNNDEATSQYCRLFLYVMKLLAQKGLKRLDRSHLLEELKLPPLSSEDATLLQNTVRQVIAIESRIIELEKQVAQHGQAISKMATEGTKSNISANRVNIVADAGTTINFFGKEGSSFTKEELTDLVKESLGASVKSIVANAVPQASYAEQELRHRDGNQLYGDLIAAIDEWEFENAYRISARLLEWLTTNEASMPRDFTAKAYTLIGELEVIRAKTAMNEGNTFDGSKALVFLAKAKNVAPH